MAIAKMKLINITADNEYLNDVLLKFVLFSSGTSQ